MACYSAAVCEDEERQKMLKCCIEQAALLQAAQERMRELCAKHPDLVIPGTELLGNHDFYVGSGGFASVWASRNRFDVGARHKTGTGGQDITGVDITDQDEPFKMSYKSCLKVLQLPIDQAKYNMHWPLTHVEQLHSDDLISSDQFDNIAKELRRRRWFIQEAEALVACSGCANIARCKGWCLQDTLHLPTLVIDYAGGTTLWKTLLDAARVLRPHQDCSQAWTWQHAACIYQQVLTAIDWMHYLPPTREVFCLHRDVSPHNVVICWPHGRIGHLPRATLIDFGLSTLIPNAETAKYDWIQSGPLVGPNMMFIDPVMRLWGEYGRGTDIFGLGQLLMLLLFGCKAAAYDHDTPKPKGRPKEAQKAEFDAICLNRRQLRSVLHLTPTEALSHPEHPLKPCWKTCPEPVLQLLMTQCMSCTNDDRNALKIRPTSLQLLAQLASIRNTLPIELAAYVPTMATIKPLIAHEMTTTPIESQN